MDDALLAAKWMRVLASLATELRAPYLRAELLTLPTETKAAALERICARAEQGEPEAREALVSLVDLLAQPDFEAEARALREMAKQAPFLALGRLLRRPLRPAPAAAIQQPVNEARVPDYGVGRPLTLGERKALARRPTRQVLDKLLADPDPAVIRLLLNNPKVIEDDVLRLAARRPNRPDILAEIAKSPRWAHRPRVRMALVLNPSTPAEIAVPLVGLLMRSELRLVQSSTDVAPIVRSMARDLLTRRPPMKKEEPPEGGMVQ